jgi:putative ABC transport system permease protein
MNGDLRLLTVVGVVGDVRDRNLETPPQPTVYVNYRQRLRGAGNFTVVMRADAPPATVLGAARDVVRGLDPDTVPRFRTFREVFTASLEARRFNLMLVGAFAGTALLLAAVGIYGVMAYWVARRTREIGARVALGAAPRDVLRLVLGQGPQTVAAGVAFGLAGSLALTRTMESLLLRRASHRSSDLRRRLIVTCGCRPSRELRPRAPGGQGRSDGSTAARIGPLG